MREENTVFLSRDEWDDFHRRLNTYNPERERRIEAMFQEYDRTVSVHRSEGQIEIDLPWLDDEDIIAAISASEVQKPREIISVMQSEDYWEDYRSLFQSSGPYASLDAREITVEGRYMYMQTEAYSQVLQTKITREFADSFNNDSLLRCA